MKQIKLLLLLYLTIISFSFLSKTAYGQDHIFYFTTSDQVKLYVHTAGKGKPCVFVHGGPGITSYIFEATPAAKLIERKVKMIYFDQRGCGRSASPADNDYSMKRMERDMEELRVFLKIKKWSVMGHSFGGLLMTAYAKDHPANVRSLVYIHCTLNRESVLRTHIYYGTKLLEAAGDTFKADQQLPHFDQMIQVHRELAKKGIEYQIMFRSQRQKDIEDSLLTATSPRFNWDFQHRVWKMADYAIDYAKYTNQISCSVLILSGTKDYAVGPDAYKSWHFKKSQVVFYNGAHTSYQEEPKWFAETVLKFLAN
ncbi:MAG TPA: alpha/beta hydrolase [Mucilaginibacter sp.]|nr:alpha/beta hydrolase [Mucilaginibacter sp.]